MRTRVVIEDSPSTMPTWQRLRLLIGDRLWSVVLLAMASFVAGVAEAGILAISAQAATSLVDGTRSVNHKLGPLDVHTSVTTLLFIALGLAIIRAAMGVAISYYPAMISSQVQAGMRRALFAAYSVASWTRQSEDREGYFQEMMTNQIQNAGGGAVMATTLVVSSFTFIVLAASAFALNVVAAVAVLGASIILFALLRPVNALGGRIARKLSTAQIAYAGAVGEAYSVAEETHVFGVSDAQRDRIEEFIVTARRLFMRTQMLSRVIPTTYQSAVYLILVVGLIAVNSAHVSSFSSLGAVVLLLVRASSYGQQIQTSYQLIRQALPYVERVQLATESYAASQEPSGNTPLESLQSLSFERVGYAYDPERPVLDDISFSVSAGETIGIVGPSGAGKSTLVQLLLNLRHPAQGQYLVNGLPSAEYRATDWNSRISYVPQQPRLIYASVAENVRLFRPLSDEAVAHACRLARIHEDIMTWPQGYDTIVGPRARAVSGGQQQRICLARALASEPEMLVLDEPTSALDPRSEALIQESLMAIQHKLTLFIIAHRMSTLDICGRVMVILDGRLDAFDSLEQLRASNVYYRAASSVGFRDGLAAADASP